MKRLKYKLSTAGENKDKKMVNNFGPEHKLEFDECSIKAVCSASPTLSAIQEVILLHLKELSFYLLELKKMGACNEVMKHCILDTLSLIVINSNLNQKQYKELILSLENNLSQAKKLYKEECEKNEKNPHFIKSHFKHNKDFSLSGGIKKGEKYIKERVTTLSIEQKNLFDIMLMILKSTYIRAFELVKLGEDPKAACMAVLSMLNAMNFTDTPEEKIIAQIDNNSSVFYDTLRGLIAKKEECYGKMSQNEVSFSTSAPAKAIMVVGCNIKELEMVLKATDGRGVDVYTHGLDMLMAHTFPKLRGYKHLKGHFGQWCDNALLDFVMFPGAILMTRHAVQKTEYLYRGRLFTTDLIAPIGVIRIDNEDFEPLIQAALTAKGFRKGQQRPSRQVGFSEEALSKKVNEVMDKMEKGEIKHIYVVGLLNYEDEHKDYFDKFFKLVPKDCFIFSFAHSKNGKNIMHLDSIFDYTLLCMLLELLSKRKPLREISMSVFLTSCNRHTVATIFSLKKLGVKNIYMSKCQPNLANPSLIETMKNKFGVKEFFDPKEDIENTFGDKGKP